MSQPANVPRPEPTGRSSERLFGVMAEIQSGSPSALEELLEHFWADLVRYAARQLGDVDGARDVVQEAFIQLWVRRRSWIPSASPRAYLYRMVRSLVIDEKRRRRVRLLWARNPRARSAPPATPAEILDEELLQRTFEKAVGELPPRRREVFELVFIGGLSHAEAAEVTGISVQTVANQTSAALRHIRAALR